MHLLRSLPSRAVFTRRPFLLFLAATLLGPGGDGAPGSAAGPKAAQAQAVRGTLVTDRGEPVPWALVRLLDASGDPLRSSVTSSSGTFVLAAPAAGPYRIKAERIGFAATLSDTLQLEEGASRSLRLTADPAPVQLPALEVESDRVCGLDGGQGTDLIAVWTEVGKALELQMETLESGQFSFRGEQWGYAIDGVGRPLNPSRASEQTRDVLFSSSSGFYAVDPELLDEVGYRLELPSGNRQFYGPDARTLLSDPFQASHCYRVKRHGQRIGLSFEPRDLAGERVDIRGTLWLDAGTGELQTLEYDYVSDQVHPSRLDGGYLEFERLPEGAWIVREWWIREPMSRLEMRKRRVRGSGTVLWEEGGRVTSTDRRAAASLEVPGRVQPAAGLLTVPAGEPDRGSGEPDAGDPSATTVQDLFTQERPTEAVAAFRSACASGDSLTLEGLWVDLRGLATRAEIAEWESRPTATRCAFLAQLVADRALRAGVTSEERLTEHYRRLARAREDWDLASPRVQGGAAELYGRHPDLEYDDRGLVYVRMGEPDEIAFAYAGVEGDMGHRVEGWRYDRPEGRRVFFFAPVTRLGTGLRDYRLLDALWRAMGTWNAAEPIDFLSRIPTAPLRNLYLSFQGLDPAYASLAYRTQTQSPAGLQSELSDERKATLANVAYVVDSIPDAPDLDPALRFSWERLRFFNPASGETVAWLLAAARAGDLESAPAADGGRVYRVEVGASIQRGTAVTVESATTELVSRRSLEDDDAVIGRLPVTLGPGIHPFTLVVRDLGEEPAERGNWTRGSVTALSQSNLPEISDLAVAADSGGAWTRDGVTFLAITPSHVTTPGGELHLYFEVYGMRDGTPYEVEIRAVPERDANLIWAITPSDLAYRASFDSAMPGTSGISPHHIRLDLSDTADGAYVLGVRVTDRSSGRQSLPVTTPIVRRR